MTVAGRRRKGLSLTAHPGTCRASPVHLDFDHSFFLFLFLFLSRPLPPPQLLSFFFSFIQHFPPLNKVPGLASGSCRARRHATRTGCCSLGRRIAQDSKVPSASSPITYTPLPVRVGTGVPSTRSNLTSLPRIAIALLGKLGGDAKREGRKDLGSGRVRGHPSLLSSYTYTYTRT